MVEVVVMEVVLVETMKKILASWCSPWLGSRFFSRYCHHELASWQHLLIESWRFSLEDLKYLAISCKPYEIVCRVEVWRVLAVEIYTRCLYITDKKAYMKWKWNARGRMPEGDGDDGWRMPEGECWRVMVVEVSLLCRNYKTERKTTDNFLL